MFDVTALGEILIDFTSWGFSENKMRVFEQNPGGAPANVICAVSKLGLKTAFVGKVGTDMHGDFLISTLKDCGANVDGVVQDSKVFTTLAFVELSDRGERSFSFARKPGADTMLKPEELDMNSILNSFIFHVGSLSLTDEPARSATMYALKKAKDKGVIISYDPNYRKLLWKSETEAEKQMKAVLPYADMIKISEEETKLITGMSDPIEASEWLADLGIPIVVITLGANGALVKTKDGLRTIASRKAEVVDTTGAGDAFWGGFLYQMAKARIKPENLFIDRAAEFAGFANNVAVFCIGRRGAINAMPSLQDVKIF